MVWTLVVIALGVALALAQLVILVRRVRAHRAEDVWTAAAPKSANSRAKKAGAALTAGFISGCGGCGGCGCGG